MSVWSRRWCFACFVAAFALGCRRASESEPAPRQELSSWRLGFIGVNETKPVGAEGFALELGELPRRLKGLGLQPPELVRFANGPDLNEALSGGAIDVGIYGDTPAVVGRAAGLPTRLLNQTVVDMDAWLLAPAGGVSAVQDLAGKVVATSKGSYMHRYLAGLLEQQVLSGKVTLIHLLPADAQAALDRGDVAAYAAPATIAPLLVSRGARVIDRASAHPGLSGSSVTVVTEAFLKDHPLFPKQWNAVRAAAVEEVLSQSERYYAFHAATVRLPLEIARQGYPLSSLPRDPLGPSGRALLEGTKTFLVKQGLAERDFELGAWLAPGAERDFELGAWLAPGVP